MHLHDIIAMAVGLGMDAMSVSAAIGVKWHGPRQKFRLAWHMGLFQFLMPIAGWLVGSELAGVIHGVGRYVAAALVAGIGAKMLYEAIRSAPDTTAEQAEHAIEKELHIHSKDPTRGWSLVVLSVATSLDALVVGFSLGLRGEGGGIWLAAAIIGLVAAAMVLTGIVVGRRLGQRFGKRAEIVGAVILILLGASFIWL